MTERLGLSGGGRELFTPEDWDGHSLEDACVWKMRPDDEGKPGDHGIAERFAIPVLQRFLATPGHRVLRRFRRGETFQGDKFPNGIVRFNLESYILGTPVDREDHFQSRDFWGVVCTLPDGRTVIMRYFVEFANADEVFPGLLNNGIIVPEVTIHKRYKIGYTNPDVLIRYRDLALYGAGKAVPEKARFRIQLPEFGIIFGRPVPRPA